MEHQSLYRKYRSQTFEDVFGQQHITRTLQNALTGDRVAHAYLFTGPRGTGKTSTARLLAKALNCAEGPTPTPCNQCGLCLSITAGRAMDVVEVDAASETGIDNVREAIINNARYAPAEGRYKVYIIDEVHDLSKAAFDGLLKTLEEPPAHVVFVLATTEIHKVPATIISRCQRFEFRRGSVEEVRSRVEYVAQEEGVSLDRPAATLIARAAQGGWRDALSLLEQVISFAGDRVTAADVGSVLGAVEDERLAELTRQVLDQDGLASLSTLDSLLTQGKDIRQLLHSFSEYLRDCLLLSMGGPDDASRTFVKVDSRTGMRMLELTARAERELRWNTQHRIVLELMLLRMAAPATSELGSVPAIDAPAPARHTVQSPHPTGSTAQPRPVSGGGSVSAATPPTPRPRPLHSPPSGVTQPAASAVTPAASDVKGAVPDDPFGPSAAETASGEPAASIDLETVQSQWKAFVNRVGGRSRRLQALLREASPVDCARGVLTLQFRQQYHYQGVD